MSDRKVLVLYFSWGGHTRKAAKQIAAAIGADLHELKPEKPYPRLYPICAARAKKERDRDERPAFAALGTDLAAYTDIVIGYPAWWYTCPMLVLSFLAQHDLAGKDVYLFDTHGGSGPVGTEDVRAVCKGRVRDCIDGSHLTNDTIRAWLGDHDSKEETAWKW